MLFSCSVSYRASASEPFSDGFITEFSEVRERPQANFLPQTRRLASYGTVATRIAVS